VNIFKLNNPYPFSVNLINGIINHIEASRYDIRGCRLAQSFGGRVSVITIISI